MQATIRQLELSMSEHAREHASGIMELRYLQVELLYNCFIKFFFINFFSFLD